MPFRFKMQKVLDYREQLEEEAKVRLATAQRRFQEARERLDALQAELRGAQDRLCNEALMEAGERWLLEQYVKGLRGDVAAASLQARMLAQMVEEARNLLAGPRHRQKTAGKTQGTAETLPCPRRTVEGATLQ